MLIHAIIDALLGAANLGDIGNHFPDNDPGYAGISSIKLLEQTMELIASKGYGIGNIDCTLILQSPKISPFIHDMKVTLCNILHIDEESISIKATTTERLGFTGRGEGAGAIAVALIQK